MPHVFAPNSSWGHGSRAFPRGTKSNTSRPRFLQGNWSLGPRHGIESLQPSRQRVVLLGRRCDLRHHQQSWRTHMDPYGPMKHWQTLAPNEASMKHRIGFIWFHDVSRLFESSIWSMKCLGKHWMNQSLNESCNIPSYHGNRFYQLYHVHCLCSQLQTIRIWLYSKWLQQIRLWRNCDCCKRCQNLEHLGTCEQCRLERLNNSSFEVLTCKEWKQYKAILQYLAVLQCFAAWRNVSDSGRSRHLLFLVSIWTAGNATSERLLGLH